MHTSPTNWITFESLMHNRPRMSQSDFHKCAQAFDIELVPDVEEEVFTTERSASNEETKIDFQGFWRLLYKVLEHKYQIQRNVRFISSLIVKKLHLDDLQKILAIIKKNKSQIPMSKLPFGIRHLENIESRYAQHVLEKEYMKKSSLASRRASGE